MSSSITNHELSELISSLEEEKQLNNQKIMILLEKMKRIEIVIGQFIEMVHMKTKKIKED